MRKIWAVPIHITRFRNLWWITLADHISCESYKLDLDLRTFPSIGFIYFMTTLEQHHNPVRMRKIEAVKNFFKFLRWVTLAYRVIHGKYTLEWVSWTFLLIGFTWWPLSNHMFYRYISDDFKALWWVTLSYYVSCGDMDTIYVVTSVA